MPVLPLHSLTSQSLDAKFAPKQRRYNSSFSASYLHHPSPPPRLAAPVSAPNPTFEALRAAAARLNLPNEDEQHGPPAASATLAKPRRPARKALLGATALALCALAAVGYYAWTARASDGGPAASRITLEALARRLHDLTANQPMFRVVGEKIALLQPALLSWPMTKSAAPAVAVARQPARDEGPGSVTPAPSTSLPGPPNPSDASSPTGASPSGLPILSETAAPTPEAAGQAKPVPAQAEPTALPPAAAGTASNGAEAAASVPPVITAQQLVDTLALLRQMGLLVRDVQAENEGLRAQVAGLTGIMQGKVANIEQRLVATAHDMHDAHDENAQLRAQVAALADTLQTSSKAFEQRLSPALARNPAAVSEPGKPEAEAPAPPAPPPAADATTSGFVRTVRDYHVQAASLGIAVLGDADPVPGQAGRHLVAVGDQVPGVGRVISITQRGTSWVVQTDHGAIQ